MMEYFPGDTYVTPPNVKRALREYLMLGSRWSPYSFFIQIIFKYRALALRGLYNDEVWARSSFEIISNLEKCGAHFDIRGLDHVRALQGPAVFVSNHMGTLETTALPGLICPIRPVTYVVKDTLTRGPIWGPIMRSRDPITVSRKDPRKDLEAVLSGGTDRLARGISIIIFPQGTRTDVFDRSKFNSLAVKLASKAQVPLVPVAIKTDFWGNSPLFHGFGPVRRDRVVHIEFGEPLTVQGRGKAEHEACVEFIEGRLIQWGARVVDPRVSSSPAQEP